MGSSCEKTDLFIETYFRKAEAGDFKNQRIGQSWMNTLREFDPVLYDKITGTKFDPFFNDQILQDFYMHVDDAFFRDTYPTDEDFQENGFK